MKVTSLLAQHITKKKMKPQRKCRLGTARNNYWGGGGVKPVLRCINKNSHFPPQFTQFNQLQTAALHFLIYPIR